MDGLPRHLRTLEHVPRWNIARVLKRQSVLEHSALVASYAEAIAERIGWKGDYYKLIKYALQHDWPEVVTGDTPSPFKKAVIDVDKLAEFEADVLRRYLRTEPEEVDTEVKAIVKLADIIESILYLSSEIALGNTTVRGLHRLMYDTMVEFFNKFACELHLDDLAIYKIRKMVNVAILDELQGQCGFLIDADRAGMAAGNPLDQHWTEPRLAR